MAQLPVKAESIQIDPASAGSRTISMDVDGSLKFSDPSVTVKLYELAGINLVTGIYVVGSGYGSKYASISDAVSDIPTFVGKYVVLVMPGTYDEDIVIEKDNISIVGIGYPVVRPLTNSDTITIQPSVTTTPENLLLKDIRVENSNAGKACVRVIGSSGTSMGGIRIQGCNLYATGVGSYQVRANVLNSLDISDCVCDDNFSSVSSRISQCSSLKIYNSRLSGIQLDYDSTGVIPSVLTSSYLVSNSTVNGNVTVNLQGVGSAKFMSVSGIGTCDFTIIGDRSVEIDSSKVRDISITGSTVRVWNSYKRNVSGVGLYSENVITGSLPFAASASESYVFDVEMIDDQYTVFCESDTTEPISVSGKLSTGFDLDFSSPQTTTVNFVVMRRS